VRPHRPGVAGSRDDEPGGLYAQLSQDLPTALARAFDQAAINGKDLRTGSAGPFADYLAQTPNSVALGTANAAAGGIYTDLLTGAGKVVNKNYGFTGFAADPRMAIDAGLSIDSNGRPLFQSANDGASLLAATGGRGTLAGLPAFVSQGVSGLYWREGDKIQTITLVGTPTGGTFDLMSGGNTATLAYNATTGTVQTAVRAWGGIYATCHRVRLGRRARRSRSPTSRRTWPVARRRSRCRS
jgi:hypothetical protein